MQTVIIDAHLQSKQFVIEHEELITHNVTHMAFEAPDNDFTSTTNITRKFTLIIPVDVDDDK
jgi:hypothetical protein